MILFYLYLFGCVTEENSFPLSYKVRGQARTNADTMYSRVLKEAIPYSGALVIDGWNPGTDWATVDTIVGNSMLDADMPFPKIYIFSCPSRWLGKFPLSLFLLAQDPPGFLEPMFHSTHQ